MIVVSGRKIVGVNETVLVNRNDHEVSFKSSRTSDTDATITFKNDAISQPKIVGKWHNGFKLELVNFASPLGAAASGAVQTLGGSDGVRPGHWTFTYAVSVQSIGKDYLSLHVTTTEESQP